MDVSNLTKKQWLEIIEKIECYRHTHMFYCDGCNTTFAAEEGSEEMRCDKCEERIACEWCIEKVFGKCSDGDENVCNECYDDGTTTEECSESDIECEISDSDED